VEAAANTIYDRRYEMDYEWERSVPLYKLDLKGVDRILQAIDSKWTAVELQEVTIGCRNTNYIIKTSLGPYFLRIFPPEDENYINESAAADMLGAVIQVPALYHVARLEDRTCMIYEYIDGTSMQSLFMPGVGIKEDILRQVPRTAAKIHSFSRVDAAGFNAGKLKREVYI
jgi:Ser/Thr protein kinase RdoA (MazF antagonist)